MWLDDLKKYAEQHPIVLMRFTEDEWAELAARGNASGGFSIARSHGVFEKVKPPAPCLIIGTNFPEYGEPVDERTYFGILATKQVVTTLESRVRVSFVKEIIPSSVSSLAGLVTVEPHAARFADALTNSNGVVVLTAKLSSHLIEKLSEILTNTVQMQAVAEGLSARRRFDGNVSLQADAIKTALAVIGVSGYHEAISLDSSDERPTGLKQYKIREDTVIEHDARFLPGYDLVESYVTGRALFRHKGGDDGNYYSEPPGVGKVPGSGSYLHQPE